MILALLASVRAFARRLSLSMQYALVTAFAALLAFAIEWWGLAQGRWAYLPDMPRLAGTRFGVVPLLQMAILAPLTMWLAHRTQSGA